MYQEFDYIVVGGGSAGCTLANRLSKDPHTRVLLIEAGKWDRDLMIHMPGGMLEIFRRKKHQWNMLSVPQKNLGGRQLEMITGKALGGSSAINAMLHIRGTAKDYDRWASDFGCEGWSYADVLPYFRATESNRNGANDQRGGDGELHVMSREQDLPSGKLVQLFNDAAVECGIPQRNDFCDGVAEGVGWTQAAIKNGKRHSAAAAFIHPVRKERPNLSIVTQALAEKILFDQSGATPVAEGVIYSKRGKKITAKARKEVILTAGALRTPALLQVSGIGDERHLESVGITPVVNLPGVGENLHDHPNLKIQYHLNEPLSMAGIGIFEQAKIGAQWLFKKSGIASWNHFDANMFIRTLDELDEADIQIQMIPIIATNAEEGFIDDHGVTFLVCLLAEKSRGSVKVRSDKMRDTPDFDLGFMENPDDYSAILRGVDFIRRFVKADGWGGRLDSERLPGMACDDEEKLKAFIRDTVETDYHYAGTCCMGDPEASYTVVDPKLRVKGVKNLRVADASIMPIPMHGNTNHACIMIGAKAADIILHEK